MGTFANLRVDFQAIHSLMAPTVLAWMNATIRLVEPKIGSGEFSPWTNTVEGGGPVAIWQGPARIQPIRSPERVSDGFAETDIRGVRIQLPLDFPHQSVIRKGMEIYIVDGGEDQSLRHYKYVVQTGINASTAWNRTVEALVDLGAVTNAPIPLPSDYEPPELGGTLIPDPENPGYYIWEPYV